MSQQIARGTPRRHSKEQATKSLMPKYDHFSLALFDTPNGWTPIVNSQERQYLRERFDKIEKSRKEENEKSLQKHRENDNDFEQRMNTHIPEP